MIFMNFHKLTPLKANKSAITESSINREILHAIEKLGQ